MKSFRFVVLVLLAMLLPFRGAVAAAAPCQDAGEAHRGVAERALMNPHDRHVQGHASMHAQHAADHGSGIHADGGLHGQPTPKCPVCVGGCNATPLAEAVPGVSAPRLVAELVFPPFVAPEPAFHSEGPERPPRTI